MGAVFSIPLSGQPAAVLDHPHSRAGFSFV